MVVIREDKSAIERRFSPGSVERWIRFSKIIGYSVEAGDEIKIELNPDRPDLFSFETLDAASRIYFDGAQVREITFRKIEDPIIIKESALKLRRHFAAFIADGIVLGDHFKSLIDFQEKIHDTIGKQRKKVSIGLHDMRRITFPVRYEAIPAKDIRFTTFDGMSGTAFDILEKHPKGIEFSSLLPGKEEVPLIIDSEGGVLSMPPIVNGNKSVVSEETEKLLVDITGTDKSAVRAAYYMLSNFLSVCGFSLGKPRIEFDGGTLYGINDTSHTIKVTKKGIRNYIGIDLPPEECRYQMKRMGILTEGSDFPFQVKVPGNRIDIMGEVDVIEDIAKAIGYSSIEASTIPISSSGSENPVNSFADTMRDIFIGAGFQEIVTYVVTSGEVYGGMGAHPDYQIMNPKSLEFSFIRNLLYPGMLDFLRRNTNRSFPQRVFEVGNVISGSIQAMKACIMIIDSRAGYSEIKSNIDAILLRITAQKCTVVPEKIDAAIEGRSGKILINSERIGIVGEIHPEILRKFSLPLPVVFAEFDLSTLSKIYGH